MPNITIGAPVLTCVHKTVEGAYMDCHMMVADPLRVRPGPDIPRDVSPTDG